MLKANNAFGILTLATPNDYLKAIGLALSARVSNPGIPIAVACSAKVRPLVAPYFDHVIDEKPNLKGFVHKVYLDQYSPFVETMFFDSDVLLFKPVRPYIESWGLGPYYACGHLMTNGTSTFGLDRQLVLKKIGKQKLVVIDGAGHAFFRQPSCQEVFDLAREVTREHAHYAGDIPYADEDVIDIVMTMLDLEPAPFTDFFARCMSAVPGTMEMDASRGLCRFIAVFNGKTFEPCMVHFAANEAPYQYTVQLIKLFKLFGVDTKGLLRLGFSDFFELEVRMRASSWKNRIKKRISRQLA